MPNEQVEAGMVMVRFRGAADMPSALEIKAGKSADSSIGSAPWRLIANSGGGAAILKQVLASLAKAYSTPGGTVTLTIKPDANDPTFGTIVSSP